MRVVTALRSLLSTILNTSSRSSHLTSCACVVAVALLVLVRQWFVIKQLSRAPRPTRLRSYAPPQGQGTPSKQQTELVLPNLISNEIKLSLRPEALLVKTLAF